MQSILLDYPSFAMEFALLVNAGLTPQKSWMMASEKNNATEFYSEAGKVSLRCNTGSPFVDSLMAFSAGLAIPEINTFVSVVTQSVKNGGQDMTHMLKRHALQCWEKRRMEVRKKAEEAGAKLVFPLMLGLVGIIAILVFPAVYMIKNF
jgi:tight adherence protein C